jgi:hypothetical protein
VSLATTKRYLMAATDPQGGSFDTASESYLSG